MAPIHALAATAEVGKENHPEAPPPRLRRVRYPPNQKATPWTRTDAAATHVGSDFAPIHADGRGQLAVFQLQWDEPGNLACLEASRALGDALVGTLRLRRR